MGGGQSETYNANEYSIKKSTLLTYLKNKDLIWGEQKVQKRKIVDGNCHARRLRGSIIVLAERCSARNFLISGPISSAKASESQPVFQCFKHRVL